MLIEHTITRLNDMRLTGMERSVLVPEGKDPT